MECRRSRRRQFPDPSPGSTSDDIFSWPAASSSCYPTKTATVCVKSTSRSRLIVIETVSLPESSAIAKARRTVHTGMSTDSTPTVAGKTDILLFTELFALGIVYYCDIPHQSADNPYKNAIQIKANNSVKVK